MEVYSDNSESPTKHHKHKKNFGCAIAAIVSSNKPNKVGKAKKKSQSPPKTPMNLETRTNTIQNHQSKRDPLEVQQKRADVQRIGN